MLLMRLSPTLISLSKGGIPLQLKSLYHRWSWRPAVTSVLPSTWSLPQRRGMARIRKARVIRREINAEASEMLEKKKKNQTKDARSDGLWPKSKTPRMHYCTKQHLWMRAVAENPYEYRIDVGLTPRAWDSIGDMLKVELYGGEEGASIRNAQNIFYEEGDYFLSVQWEGIEMRDPEFYLVTGTNIWRCPIRGTVRLNPDDAHRKWKVDRPDSHHVLLTIHVSVDDYLVKLRQEESPPEDEEEPPLEDPDPPRKHKVNPNKNPKTNDPLVTYRHRWVNLQDYETFMRDMDP